MRRFCSVAVLAIMLGGTAAPAGAQDLRREIEGVVKEYIQNNPQAIQQIIRDYLVNNPEILQRILVDALKKQQPSIADTAAPTPPAADKARLVRSNAAALFNSPHQVTLGNPEGDVTLVEFFDYSCGFCKRALGDKIELLKSDPKLRIVLKEYPILGPNSLEAARIGVAVRMQDPAGSRYLEFHKALLGDRMPPTRERVLAAARDAGIDMARLDQDLASDEVGTSLDENTRLARALGINGTPSYVVGEQVVIGAVGLDVLRSRIHAARK
jgi:protein-disulfide isomerase